MNALNVRNLTKRYPDFLLDRVSFSVGEGRVCGLIGANGAGKTTVLKGITGLIRAQGEREIFGIGMDADERAAKRYIGYVGGGFRFYPQKTVLQIARATAAFFPEWDWELFRRLLAGYGIDGHKKIAALSDGMKVKAWLSLALSHGARLLILDEPTSGLDPFSREEFCDTILSAVRDGSVSVLFSTHVASDLTRIADDVVFLSRGKMLLNEPLETLLSAYMRAVFRDREGAERAGAVGVKQTREGYEGLIAAGGDAHGAAVFVPTLDEIIIHLEAEERGI